MKRIWAVLSVASFAGQGDAVRATPFDGVYAPNPGACRSLSDGRTELRGNRRQV